MAEDDDEGERDGEKDADAKGAGIAEGLARVALKDGEEMARVPAFVGSGFWLSRGVGIEVLGRGRGVEKFCLLVLTDDFGWLRMIRFELATFC